MNREMRKTLALTMVTITAVAIAVEKTELMPLIETASTNREPSSVTVKVLSLRPGQPEPAREVIYHESAYVKIRNKIVEYGRDALPLLAEIAVDENLPWQQQLVARICKERIEREKDIEALLATDWYKHPDFNPNWSLVITGPEPGMGTIIVPELKDAGLWYHCLEVLWKMTSEKGNCISDPDLWARWCTLAVKDSPERVWLLRAFDDMIETTPPPPRLHWLFTMLTGEQKNDTTDVLEKYKRKFPPPPPQPPRQYIADKPDPIAERAAAEAIKALQKAQQERTMPKD